MWFGRKANTPRRANHLTDCDAVSGLHRRRGNVYVFDKERVIVIIIDTQHDCIPLKQIGHVNARDALVPGVGFHHDTVGHSQEGSSHGAGKIECVVVAGKKVCQYAALRLRAEIGGW